MTRPTRPDDTNTWQRDIERRLKALETGNQAGDTTVTEGATRVRDEEGLERVRIGALDGEGGYGVEVYDEDGGRRFRADGQGLKDPYIPLTWLPRDISTPGWIQSIDDTTSGFEGLWDSSLWLLSHGGVIIVVDWQLEDPDMEGRLRIVGNNTATAYDQLDSIGVSGAGKTSVFKWRHRLDLGEPADFAIEAEIVSGTGSLSVYYPQSGLLADPTVCTNTGL